VVYVVNRDQNEGLETALSLNEGYFGEAVEAYIVNGDGIKTENSFDAPEKVVTRRETVASKGQSFTYTFEPHSVTALVFTLQ
jgi:alpha-L-arabinofuranosidase